MKIKRKVELNLPQLIEWAWENDVRCKTFIANDKRIPGKVNFDENGMVNIQTIVGKYETITVEVEEVVDSNTVLDNVYTVNVEEGTSHTTYYKSKSINEVKTDEINIIYTILQEEAIVLWDSQGGFR